CRLVDFSAALRLNSVLNSTVMTEFSMILGCALLRFEARRPLRAFTASTTSDQRSANGVSLAARAGGIGALGGGASITRAELAGRAAGGSAAGAAGGGGGAGAAARCSTSQAVSNATSVCTWNC